MKMCDKIESSFIRKEQIILGKLYECQDELDVLYNNKECTIPLQLTGIKSLIKILEHDLQNNNTII